MAGATAAVALAPSPPLRDEVLAGRFFGRGHDGNARAVADFAAARPDASLLRVWYGDGALAALLDGPDAAERLRESLDRDVAALDARIAAQTDALLRHPRLARLEGSWRGLRWLADRVPWGGRVRIRLLPARWAEICRDFERAPEFDQSHLFRKVYEEEFGRPGGEPYGLIVADYEVRHAPAPGHATDDVAGLDGLAAVAAAAFAPTAVAAHPALLGLESYADAGASLDLTEVLRGPERARWRALAAREDARFLAVLLPRALGRAPWADDGTRAEGFRPHPSGIGPRAWTSPGYALAATAMRAFARNGWPADVRGATVSREASGGVVDALPEERHAWDAPGPAPRPPVELCLTDLQERQAVEAGLLPLIGLEGLPEAAFAATPSLHRPPRMTGAEGTVANANQRLSSQFNAVLCVSRFAHCIKVMGRDMVGSFQNAEDIQSRLQKWLAGFSNASPSAGGGESGARYPLRGARVEVRERAGRPGVFGCTIHLQPHYQLDEVGAAFRLVTDLEGPARAAA